MLPLVNALCYVARIPPILQAKSTSCPCLFYVGPSTRAQSTAPATVGRYIPRGRNELHTIFDHHFTEFCEQYEQKYASTYGMYRLDRIKQVGERFATCGDYLQGIARIRCTNPECGHDYFRAFSLSVARWG